jgi:hypothetical protein
LSKEKRGKKTSNGRHNTTEKTKDVERTSLKTEMNSGAFLITKVDMRQYAIRIYVYHYRYENTLPMHIKTIIRNQQYF